MNSELEGDNTVWAIVKLDLTLLNTPKIKESLCLKLINLKSLEHRLKLTAGIKIIQLLLLCKITKDNLLIKELTQS